VKVVKIFCILSLLFTVGCVNTERKVTAEDVLDANNEVLILYEEYNKIKDVEDEIIVEEVISDDQDEISYANYSRLRTNYFTKENIINARISEHINEDSNPRDFMYSSPEFIRHNGFFPVAILKNNNVIRGGHSGHLRSTGFKHEVAHDIFLESIFNEIDYFFIVRTNHEGNPKGVHSRSNIIKNKWN